MTSGPSLAEEDGFTIVELLVCLALLAFITAFMAEGLLLMKRGGAVIDEVERADSSYSVRMHVRRTLEGAIPRRGANGDGAGAIVFEGKSDWLRFASRADGRLESPGLVAVEFMTQGVGGQQSLVTRRRSLTAETTELEPLVHRLGQTGAVRFRYFGPTSIADDPTWADEWSHPDSLPLLVELTFAPASGKGPAAVPLIVAIPAARRPSG